MHHFLQSQSIYRMVALFLITSSSTIAQVPENWKKVSQIGFEQLLNVSYGGGTWVALSGDGVQLTSQDGSAWTTGNHENLSTSVIAYGDGAWIAGFQSFWRSEDLVTWTEVLKNGAIGNGTTFGSIQYANGLWVATGGEALGGRTGKIATSNDGVTWQERFSEDGSYIESVHYAEGKWLAVSKNFELSTFNNLISFVYQSVDGNTWSKVGEVADFGEDIFFGDGRWLISGESLHSSNDGEIWTKVEVADFTPTQVRFGNGQWVGVGVMDLMDDVVVTSSDGLDWKAVTESFGEKLNGVHYDNGQWIAVGNSGLILKSTDATTWTEVSDRQGLLANLNQVQFADGLWSAAGRRFGITGLPAIYVSPDGQTWAPQLELDIDNSIGQLVVESGIRLATTGAFGEGNFVVSTDGETWTEHENSNFIRRIAAGQGKFLGIVNNTLFSSTNGITWTPAVVPQFEDLDFISNIGFANNLWLIGAEDDDEESLVFSSTDGTSWKVLNAPGELDVQAELLTYGGDTWITTSQDGTKLLASSDGETWTERLVAPDAPSIRITSLTYGDGSWLAVQDGAPEIFSSDDSETWTGQVVEDGAFLYNGQFANDLWVVVGLDGAIFVGGQGLPQDLPVPPLFISQSSNSVALSWTPNQAGLTLEASPSLREADFSAVLNQPSAGENGIVDYLVSGNDSRRFFRLRR